MVEKNALLSAMEIQKKEASEQEDELKRVIKDFEFKLEQSTTSATTSDQQAAEFREAMSKIRQLTEEKTAATKELDTTKDALSQLKVEVLGMKKELLDSQIQASDAMKKMENAEEMREHLIKKNKQLAEEVDNLRSGEASSELNLLRRIVATKEGEVEKLKRQLELSKLSPTSLLDALTPKKKEVTARVYCDMCECWDKHDTTDCPLQVCDTLSLLPNNPFPGERTG